MVVALEGLNREKIRDHPHLHDMLHLYFLASKCCLEEVADRALTGYITYHKHFEMISAPEHMGSVYARSTPGSKIHQYVADEAAFVWVSKCYYNNDNDGH